MTSHEHYLDEIARYDENIPRILPSSELFFSTVLSFLPDTPLSILELGSGTGYFTSRLIKKNPKNHITCIDKSPEVIKLAGMKPEISGCNLVEGDITTGLPEEKYSAVITTLTLHHISDKSRANLIKEIYQKLPSDGLFICGDVFKPENEWIEQIYRNRWEKHMRNAGMPDTRIKDTLSGREKAYPLIDTTHGFYKKMQDAGFNRILVPLHYDMFGICVGWK